MPFILSTGDMHMKPTNTNSAKNRRDIGKVVPLIEKMNAAREISSCCVGVEALLETNNEIDGYVKRVKNRNGTRIKSTGLIFAGLICGFLVSYAWAAMAPPTEHKGLQAEMLGNVSEESVLSQVGLKGYKLLLRRITINPGGQIAKHSHATSPGVVYVESGTWIEGRESGEAHYSAGDTFVEDKDTIHWFYNRGDEPAAAIVCDIKPTS
jgi:quercetin dioxygenase-like cupin family protein